ncbi:hypothetical protein LOTGIDRAFT_97896, partial [Lottia gigantea]
CPSIAFGMFAHCGDCSKFVMCIGQRLVPIDCPAGLVFDPSINVCNYQSQANC